MLSCSVTYLRKQQSIYLEKLVGVALYALLAELLQQRHLFGVRSCIVASLSAKHVNGKRCSRLVQQMSYQTTLNRITRSLRKSRRPY